jgi:hypothetical protein
VEGRASRRVTSEAGRAAPVQAENRSTSPSQGGRSSSSPRGGDARLPVEPARYLREAQHQQHAPARRSGCSRTTSGCTLLASATTCRATGDAARRPISTRSACVIDAIRARPPIRPKSVAACRTMFCMNFAVSAMSLLFFRFLRWATARDYTATPNTGDGAPSTVDRVLPHVQRVQRRQRERRRHKRLPPATRSRRGRRCLALRSGGEPVDRVERVLQRPPPVRRPGRRRRLAHRCGSRARAEPAWRDGRTRTNVPA